MDTAEADKILKEILARWDQEDNLALGRNLTERLQLQCQSSWSAYAQQVEKLVGRSLTSTETIQLRYFYLKQCPPSGQEIL
jgi:hypothetical protein